MRLLQSLAYLASTAVSDTDSGTDCTDREIRLWFHVDLTGSFVAWRNSCAKPLTEAMSDLTKKYPKLKFGVSGFGDRPDVDGEKGQMDNTCYIDGVNFDTDPATKYKGIIDLMGEYRTGYVDNPEDPLSGMAFVAKQKFGDYANNELRILSMVTDFGPHWSPYYHDGPCEEPDQPPEDYNTCNNQKRWFTVDEYFDPVKTRRIMPIVGLYPQDDTGMADWTNVFNLAGYNVTDSLHDMGNSYDLNKFLSIIEDIINQNSCSPAPTNAPSQGTVPTDAPATTAVDPDVTTTPAPATGSSPDRKPAVIGAAAAGAAALLAAGLGAKFLRAPSPQLDVVEEAMDEGEAIQGQDREAAIQLDESAYGE